MMQSDNILVHYMARKAMYNVIGTLGMNRVIIRHKFGVPDTFTMMTVSKGGGQQIRDVNRQLPLMQLLDMAKGEK